MTRQDVMVERILNSPIPSNCYIITKQDSDECILVDPSHGDGSFLAGILSKKKLKPVYIILTHEHFDHISSVEWLRKKYECKVIASMACSESIINPKKNLSLFYDQVGFSCSPADIIINETSGPLQWGHTSIQFYITPGHSKGGMCFNIEDKLFTGDTLMKEYTAVVKLPGGDKMKLSNSVDRLMKASKKNTLVYPGHGEQFNLSDWEI